MLLARLLDVNETQEGVIQAAFAMADDEGMLLLDLKDLQAMMNFLTENAKEVQRSTACQRRVGRRDPSPAVGAGARGGEGFFGEPSVDLHDFMRTDRYGFGNVNILAADKLIQKPKLYATFLLWLLSELFEELPEVGDADKPKLVLFFDEAHLLFDDAPDVLIDRIEQVVRLIRSKGVGVFFITQSPADLPETVLGQLGNRVQHALRAFTPKDRKAVRAAAQTFRDNPKLDTETVIGELGIGEALVSVLEDGGAPSVVERTLIRPPSSRLGPATPEERQGILKTSPFGGRYDQPIDRESAYEVLSKRAEEATLREEEAAKREAKERESRRSTPRSRGGSRRQSVGEAMVKSVARSVGSQIGRQIVRGILGSILKGLSM